MPQLAPHDVCTDLAVADVVSTVLPAVQAVLHVHRRHVDRAAEQSAAAKVCPLCASARLLHRLFAPNHVPVLRGFLSLFLEA